MGKIGENSYCRQIRFTATFTKMASNDNLSGSDPCIKITTERKYSKGQESQKECVWDVYGDWTSVQFIWDQNKLFSHPNILRSVYLRVYDYDDGLNGRSDFFKGSHEEGYYFKSGAWWDIDYVYQKSFSKAGNEIT